MLLGAGAHAGATPAEPAPAALPRTATVERRQVVVIDLVGDDEAGVMARSLGERLVRDTQLAPLADPAIAASLIGPIFDEDSAAMEAARRALADAGDALARFELGVAAARAAAGQTELNNVEPTPAAIALYADLAFVLGQAKLADGDGPAARSSFLLTQRLTPERTLDPARYLPDVISAYRQARRGGGGRVPIQIRGQGAAFVDGVAVGTAPMSLEIATGAHVVHLFGPTRLARGTRIEVTPTSPAVVVLPDARAAHAVVIGRARRVLAASADATARATAISELAKLVGVGDAVVLSRGPTGLCAQAWRDRAPGAGQIHNALDRDAAAIVLADLAPPPQERPAPGALILPRPAPPTRWYRKRWVQASLVTGALAMIATAVMLSTSSGEGTVALDPYTTF